MPANLENAAVATGLEKVSFHSNPKERQCQRMLKLPHNCTHLTCQQSNAQNSPSRASTVHELRTSRCSSWIQKRQRNQRSNWQLCWITEKPRDFPKTIYICFIDYVKAFDCVEYNKLENSLKDENTRPPYLPPEESVCRSRRLLLGRKAMTNLDSILESRDITLSTKVHLSKLCFFQLSCMDVKAGL